jgi:uncharacterized protein
LKQSRIDVPNKLLEEFCRKNQTQELSLFGSVLRDDFGPDSDIDILVKFKSGKRIGLLQLTRLELELGEIFGRKVDLNTPGFISKYFRSKVMVEREIQYADA